MVKVKERVMVDTIKQGTMDLVTDRSKSKLLSIVTSLVFPIILLNLGTTYIVEYVPDQWAVHEAKSIVIYSRPEVVIMGEPCGRKFEVIVTNKHKLPVEGLRVTAGVKSVLPEDAYDFCRPGHLVEGTLDKERLGMVCLPLLDRAELFTNGSGMVDFTQMAAVAGVPGIWDLEITAYSSATERIAGEDVQVYTAMASTAASIRVSSNPRVEIVPERNPPKELEYHQIMDGVDHLCTVPDNLGPSDCLGPTDVEGPRPDLSPPAARIIYTGNTSISDASRMVLFVVGDFGEIGKQNLSIARSRYPQRAMSNRKFSRITNGVVRNMTAVVDGSTGIAQFANFRVEASNNPTLFLAFYSLGKFRLWNKHYTDRGSEMAVEIGLNPPLQPSRARAAQGAVWTPPLDLTRQEFQLLDAAGRSNAGAYLGDQTYLTQIEVTGDYPRTIKEGEPFQMIINAFSYRYPRNQGRAIFPDKVAVIAEAVPSFPVRGAVDAPSYFQRVKGLYNAVSPPSVEGDVGVLFTNLAFSTHGEPGKYRLRFYTEGRYQVTTGLDIEVTTSVDIVRALLPPLVQLKYPGCALDIIPRTDNNLDGSPDFALSEQLICQEMEPFKPLSKDDLPYLEAYSCPGALAIDDLLSDCMPVSDRTLKIKLTAKNRETLNLDANGTVRWVGMAADHGIDEVSYATLQPFNGRYEISSLRIPHAFASSWLMNFTVGGVTAAGQLAISMDEAVTKKLEDADLSCGYAPVGHIRILGEEALPLQAVPGNLFEVSAIAIDILGRPAANRTLCLRMFPLDLNGRDYFADMIEHLTANDMVAEERRAPSMDPFTVQANATFKETNCFLTDDAGQGKLEYYWQNPGARHRKGMHAWYLESAEFEDVFIYEKLTTIYGLKSQNKARLKERSCYSDFGYDIPTARTASFFIDILESWSQSAPTMILPFSRQPLSFPGVANQNTLSYELPSYYGGTDRRTIPLKGETDLLRHNIFVRVYNGGSVQDDLPGDNGDLFPARVQLFAYLVSAPEGFPGTRGRGTWPYSLPPERCMPADVRQPSDNGGDCWDENDLILSPQGNFLCTDGSCTPVVSATNDNGIAQFDFRATTPGIYRVLLSASSLAVPPFGANDMSVLLEIKVERAVRESPHCRETAVYPDRYGRGFSPYISSYNNCPMRQQDGSCPRTATEFCHRPDVQSAAILSEPPSAACTPLGAPLPGSFSVAVLSDAGERIPGYTAELIGAEGKVIVSHNSVVGPTDATGTGSVVPVIDYADPGTVKVAYKVPLAIKPLEDLSLPAQTPLVITDLVEADFLVQPPATVGLSVKPEAPITVQINLVRKCQEARLMHMWKPPPLELFVFEYVPSGGLNLSDPTALNGTGPALLGLGADAPPPIHVAGALAQPAVQVAGVSATAIFPDFTVTAGIRGVYRLGLRVPGGRTLAQSLPMSLQVEPAVLKLLDDLPPVVSFELSMELRVRAESAGGTPVPSAFVYADISALDPSLSGDAGKVASTDKNVSAFLDLSTSRAFTDVNGIAHFRLFILNMTQTDAFYVVTFKSGLGTAPASSKSFRLVSGMASVELISQPVISQVYSPRWTWPLLKSKLTPITLNTEVVQVPIPKDAPEGMRTFIVGEAKELGGVAGQIVVRIKDWRGFGMTGKRVNVTMVDFDNNILDLAKQGYRNSRPGGPEQWSYISQDWGMESVADGGTNCVVNQSLLDCAGLYKFEGLSTANMTPTGFYQFRFEVNGVEIVQPGELLFSNIALKDDTWNTNPLMMGMFGERSPEFKEGFMLLSALAISLCYSTFRHNCIANRALDTATGKFEPRKDDLGLVKGLAIALLSFLFIMLNWVYFDLSDLEKLPPYFMDGQLTFADGWGRLTTVSILGFLLILSISVSMIESENLGKTKAREQTVRRLGFNEVVEFLRRDFINKPPKYIPAPPRVESQNPYIKKLQRYYDKLDARIEVFRKLFVVVKLRSQKLYRTVKFSIPMYRSLYSGIKDIHFPQRMLFIVAVSIYMSLSFLGVGLWLGTLARGMLSEQYGFYISVLEKLGDQQVDWIKTVNQNPEKLLDLREYVVLFAARTAPLGTPFFVQMSDAVSESTVIASYATTVVFIGSILISFYSTREYMVAMRRGKHVFPVRTLHLADACSYVGTQACCVLFGWLTTYIFFFMMLLMYLWAPMRFGYDDFMRAMWGVTIPLYFCSVVFARLVSKLYPGTTVYNRPLWAFQEFSLLFANIIFGPPLAWGRLCIGVLRNVTLWAWLQNSNNERDPLSTPGSSLYHSAMYIDHQHNAPLTRVMAERLHLELRNMSNLKLFPPDNIEPIVLRRQLTEEKEKRDRRRVIARLLLMFLLRSNQERGLHAFRKHIFKPPPPPLTLEEEMALPPSPEAGHAMLKWKKGQSLSDHSTHPLPWIPWVDLGWLVAWVSTTILRSASLSLVLAMTLVTNRSPLSCLFPLFRGGYSRQGD